MPSPLKKNLSERAPANNSLRAAERQQQEQAKQELAQLQAERRSIADTLRRLTVTHEELVQSLERIETENEQWQTPNASLGELYRLRDQREQVEKQVKECHRRWDALGEDIEEKHDEIAFGGSGDD